MPRAGLPCWFALVSALIACGPAGAPGSLLGVRGEGADTGAAGSAPANASGGQGPVDAGAEQDPTVGAPCTDAVQCDDGIDCTRDGCDATLGRCRHEPDDGACDDAVYCDGVERCAPRLGCLAGEPVACSDRDVCTVDACDEQARGCVQVPRDADGDGDPDGNCFADADCDDRDPAVSSLVPEVCANGMDDDCDGVLDEDDCSSAEHDTCADALEVTGDGTYELALGGAVADYAASCAGDGWRDVVVALVLEEARSVDLRLAGTGAMALVASDLCGDAAGELICAAGVASPAGGNLARARLHRAGPGAVPITVFSAGVEPLRLGIALGAPVAAPENETCGTALPILPGVPVTAPLLSVEQDLVTSCDGWGPELVYEFELTEVSDVEAYAVSEDGLAEPMVAVLDEPCAALEDDLACARGTPAVALARSLQPGRHYVAVSASAPTELTLELDVRPPAPLLGGDTCAEPLPLAPGDRRQVDLREAADDVTLSCGGAATDVVFEIEATEPIDLLAVLRLSEGDVGTLGILPAGCAGEGQGCANGARSPLSVLAPGLAAGRHLLVVESRDAHPVELAALTRPVSIPLLVAFAETCEDAVAIPVEGGALVGSTAGARDDHGASCDAADGAGAPDQMLTLSLPERRRVVLDARGSAYPTLIAVRSGADCPGDEVPLGCAAGYADQPSFLDLILNAGDYHVQVDGYAGASGAWRLDVFVSPP